MPAVVNQYRKTSEVARLLCSPYHRVFNLIRAGAIDPPARDGSGDYVWSKSDIDRAREALSQRRAGRRKEGSRG